MRRSFSLYTSILKINFMLNWHRNQANFPNVSWKQFRFMFVVKFMRFFGNYCYRITLFLEDVKRCARSLILKIRSSRNIGVCSILYSQLIKRHFMTAVVPQIFCLVPLQECFVSSVFLLRPSWFAPSYLLWIYELTMRYSRFTARCGFPSGSRSYLTLLAQVWLHPTHHSLSKSSLGSILVFQQKYCKLQFRLGRLPLSHLHCN